MSIWMMNERAIRPNTRLIAWTKQKQVIKSTAAHTAMRDVIIISSSSSVSERVRGILVAAIMIDHPRLGRSRRCCFVVIVVLLAL